MQRASRSLPGDRRTKRGLGYAAGKTQELDRLPLPAAVLFDLDGTLVDSVATRISSWVEALEEAGFPTSRERLPPLIGVDGKRLGRRSRPPSHPSGWVASR